MAQIVLISNHFEAAKRMMLFGSMGPQSRWEGSRASGYAECAPQAVLRRRNPPEHRRPKGG